MAKARESRVREDMRALPCFAVDQGGNLAAQGIQPVLSANQRL
jgi:hypothetical protein